jgi:hypothetical protein
MNTGRRIPAGLLIAVLVAFIPTQSRAADSPALPDACSLFSIEELGTLLDTRVRRGRPDTAEQGTSCRFTLPAETLTISLWPTTPHEFDAFRQTLADSGVELEAAAALGDSAYYWDNRLYVRRAHQGLTIQLGDVTQADPERRRKLQAIARAALAKLG